MQNTCPRKSGWESKQQLWDHLCCGMGCGRTSTGPSPLCGLLGWGKHFSCGLLGKISGNKPMAACTTPCTELIQEKPNKKSQRHHSANLHFQRNSWISRKSSSLFCVPQVGGSSCQHTDMQTGTFLSGGDVSALSHSCQHRDTGTFLISYVKRKHHSWMLYCFLVLKLSKMSSTLRPTQSPIQRYFQPLALFFIPFSSWRQDQHKEELISPWAFCGTSGKAPKSSLRQ